MESVKQNITIILLAVLCVITLFVFVILIFVGNSQGQYNRVVNIIPQSQSTLTTGTKPTIRIVFLNSSLKSYKVNFSFIEVWKSEPYKNTAINTNIDGNTLVIVPANNIISGGDYKLEVLDTNTKSVVFTAHYLSSVPTPTPYKSNDKSLIPYLPKNTNDYYLSYDSSQNAYVVNYYLDFQSKTDINTQITNIKSEVLSFIKSRGVDPNNIVIIWKGT